MILEKTKQSLLKVKRGVAVYERDSVIFDEVHHSWIVLTGLLRAALENDGTLSVLDFGGSLGSSYYQCQTFLNGLKTLKWSIVEQPNYVGVGRGCFEDGTLSFYCSIDECIVKTKPNVALFSSVLQYLKDPYEVINKIQESKIQFIIVDITPFHHSEKDLIKIQRVPRSIYDASYPFRIFGLERFLIHFDLCYEKIGKSNSLAFPALNDLGAYYMGFLFQRRGGQ